MPPPSSKNRSATTVLTGRQRAERRRAGADVEHRLLGAAAVEAALARELSHSNSGRPLFADARILRADARHLRRQLHRAPGRFAVPEGNRRRRAVRVLDPDAPGLDAADAPRRRAEQEHVARQALDGEVFVERADDRPVGLGDHEVLRVVGNGAAGRDRGETRAASAAHDAVAPDRDGETRRSARAWCDAFGKHLDDRVEVAARQIAIADSARRTSAKRSSSLPLLAAATATICCARTSSGDFGNLEPIELALRIDRDQRRALDQLIASGREQAPFGLGRGST